MIKYVLKQNKNKKSLAFGKWYAFPVVEETMDLAELAKHSICGTFSVFMS